MHISVNIKLAGSLYLNMQHGSQWQCIQVGGHHSHVHDRVSCLRNTTKRNQISSQFTCQAVVECTLKLNRLFNKLVHNSCVDLEIVSNNKDSARMAWIGNPLQFPSVALTLEEMQSGIFARRAMVDLAREGLCYKRET